VRSVGIAGSYLDTEHTLDHHRREIFSPQILNRRARNGCPRPLPEVAAARARELLAGGDEPALAADEHAALLAVERAFAAG
jgi:trimethylamine:corrinoid methyltransferase-like protein